MLRSLRPSWPLLVVRGWLLLWACAATSAVAQDTVRVRVRVEAPMLDPGSVGRQALRLEQDWSLHGVRVRPVVPASLARRPPVSADPALGPVLARLATWYTAEVPVAELGAWWVRVASDPSVSEPVVEPRAEIADTVPNDPRFAEQEWFFDLVGAPEAWDRVRGQGSEVVIAIVDTGTDVTHPDLVANLWRNPGEIEGNGIDDDGNGFVDDVLGWNFANDSNDPRGLDAQPLNRDHGTHVAGIAAAGTDNLQGVAGVGFNPRLMAINVADPFEDRFVRYGFDGILYAASMGADVINCSWRGIGSDGTRLVSAAFRDFENDVCEAATALGSLVVAATGNDATLNVATTPAFYPSVLAVTATRFRSEAIWVRANVGPWVDIAAPGEFILSTISTASAPVDPYAWLTGTSMATPIVSGAAALLRAQNPGWSPLQLRQRLRATAKPLGDVDPLRGPLAGSGLLRVDRAVGDVITPALYIGQPRLIDADGDGYVEAGEVVTIAFDLTSPFSFDGPVDLSFTSEDVYVRPLEDQIRLPRLAAGATLRVERGLEFYVRERTPPAHVARIDLRWRTATHDGVFPRWVELSALQGTVDGGGTRLSAASNGKLGYAAPTRGLLPSGAGLRGEGALASSMSFGALLVGTGPDRVSDAVQAARPSAEYEDFRPEQENPLVFDPANATAGGAQTLTLRYSDNTIAERLGVGVEHRLIAWPDGSRGSFVLSRWRVRARIEDLRDAYVGALVEWNARSSDTEERVVIDSERRFQWVEPRAGSTAPWAGVALVDGPGTLHADWLWAVAPADSSVREGRPAVFDVANLARALGDDELWRLMTRPATADTSAQGNVAGVFATGPFSLSRGESVDLVMAFAVAEGREELFAQLEAARRSWSSLREGRGGVPPSRVELLTNVPNPFNPSTDVRFAVPDPIRVRLDVYDVRGRHVRRLLDAEVDAGFHRQQWNGTDDEGRAVASGVYLVHLRTAEGQSFSRRVVLVR